MNPFMNPLRKNLFGALIGLSRASESKEIMESSGIALIHGLTLAYDRAWEQTENEIPKELETSVEQIIQTLHTEKALMAPDCAACQYPCGRTADYDMEETLNASDALRDAKLHLLSLLGKIAVLANGKGTTEIRQFLSDALFQISCTYEAGQLTTLIADASRLTHHS